ncbi:MAG: hypothetical protein AAB267_01385, partial [Candidatus Desantisbacteria bacterium]
MPYTLQQVYIILLLLLSTNISGAATAFKFGQSVQSIRAGDSFELPTLTAVDENGNTDTAYTDTHTLYYWGPQNGPIAGTPSYTTNVQFASGTCITELATTLVYAGAATLWVRDTSAANIVGSLTLNIMSASPHAFMLTTEHQEVVNAGYPFTATVTAIDIYGNTADTYEGNKSLSGTHTANNAPYGTASPTIPLNGTRTFNQGKTTIPGFVLFNASETPSLSVSDGLMKGSSLITVNPGQNYCFNVAVQNKVEAGIGFGVDLIIIDPYGNLTGTPSGTLNISCSWDATNSPDGSSLPQKPTDKDIVFTSGKASFGTFTLVNAMEMPQIIVRSGTLISGTSSPIAVDASSPVSLRLFFSGTVTSGDAFLLGTITAYDSFGNTATTYSGSKSVTYIGPNNGPEAGSPSYTRNVFFDRGISTTPLLTTLTCAETTTITIQTDGMTGISNPIIVLPGSANFFELNTQHHGTEIAGVSFLVDITAKDIFGNIASKYEGIHNINCWWNATGSVLPTKPDDVQASFSSGQATVGSFMLTNTQQTPIISVYEGNIRGTSNPITVKPADNIHHLQIITEHQGAETAGVPFTVKVIACDQFTSNREYWAQV